MQSPNAQLMKLANRNPKLPCAQRITALILCIFVFIAPLLQANPFQGLDPLRTLQARLFFLSHQLDLTEEQIEHIFSVLAETQEPRQQARQDLFSAFDSLKEWDGDPSTRAQLVNELELAITEKAILMRDVRADIVSVFTADQIAVFEAIIDDIHATVEPVLETIEAESLDAEGRQARRAEIFATAAEELDTRRNELIDAFPEQSETIDEIRGRIESDPTVEEIKAKAESLALTQEQTNEITNLYLEVEDTLVAARKKVSNSRDTIIDHIRAEADDNTIALAANTLANDRVDLRTLRLDFKFEVSQVLADEQNDAIAT
ncbi:MAG: hypothetical protein ACPGN3_03375 [Opitutales bacterium]